MEDRSRARNTSVGHPDVLRSAVPSNSSLDFSGDVVRYATKLSGSLLGIPVTLTPGT